ncbi:flagellar hook-length control protein FliK [Paenibacillus thermoaerophilus]|uniref:Flagellar hook-length control protein FliK n=1 Tax=Paenibacillus thermoaerophilus TaxID=1215385 RepID=A0ABW2V0R3_9BACL|nr:flagellar hook-length control protein FliK [Paenibacillus thermoaerophilus]TMV13798.1 flagellar hook-length control protein FliK [Paenibacillus thermoaerophilus]
MQTVTGQVQGKPALIAVLSAGSGSGAAASGTAAGGKASFASMLLPLQTLLAGGEDSSVSNASASNAQAFVPLLGAASAMPDRELNEALGQWLQEGAELPEHLLNDPAWLELLAQIQLLLSAWTGGQPQTPAAAGGSGQEGHPPEGIVQATPPHAGRILANLLTLWQAAPQHPQLQPLVDQLKGLAAAAIDSGTTAAEGQTPAFRQLLTVLGQRASANPTADRTASAAEPNPAGLPAGRIDLKPDQPITLRHEPRASVMSKLEWLAIRSGARAGQEIQTPAADAGQNTVPNGAAVSGPSLSVLARPEAAAQPASNAPVFVPVKDFAAEMANWMSGRWRASPDGSVQEARISLTPQHLGHVDVKITIHHGQLVAQFVADNPASREMLESQLSTLRAALNSQGILVEKLEVVQSGAASANLFQGRGEQSFQQRQQQQQSRSSASGSGGALPVGESLDEIMDELTFEQAGQSESGRFDASV